jgi:4-amino-4-deoxy-L-arabinose transferase-like glycosyltransferase/membrane-associated phospholipid phosphatase
MNVWFFRLVNDSMKNRVLDAILPLFSDKDYIVIPAIAFLVAGLYLGRRRTRVHLVALVLAIALSNLVAEKVIKNAFQTHRPYAAIKGVHLYRSGEWHDYDPHWYTIDPRKSNGFPSSHVVNMAAAAAVLAIWWPATLWVTAPLALLVGFSRVYTGNHFPLDVLGGYVWGVACGLVVVWAVRSVAGRLAPARDDERIQQPRPFARNVFPWILSTWVVLNFISLHVSSFDLTGDEAKYWNWSRHLQLGYYGNPPMVAYVDALLVGAGGNKEWSLRSGAVLLLAGAVALLYELAYRITRRDSAALLTACAALALPATWVGSVLMTENPLLVFFWALAMYAFHCAVSEETPGSLVVQSRPLPQGEDRDDGVSSRRADAGYPLFMWVLTGFALGMGILSNYTMAILYVAFALYLILADRRWLRTRAPFVATAVMLVLQIGMLRWNASNDWTSFRDTASVGAVGYGNLFGNVTAFWGGQAGAVSPLLLALFLWAAWRCYRARNTSRDGFFLFLCFAAPFTFYAIVSVFRAPDPSWPIAAYMAGAVALGWAWTERPRSIAARWWLGGGLALGTFMGMAVRCTDIIDVMPVSYSEAEDRLSAQGPSVDQDRAPTYEIQGGRQLGAAVSKYLAGQPEREGPFVLSDRWELSALTAFYAKGRPNAYCFNFGTRQPNQYEPWGREKLAGRDAILVLGGNEAKARLYIEGLVQRKIFESGEFLDIVPVRRGKSVITTYTLSRVRGY